MHYLIHDGSDPTAQDVGGPSDHTRASRLAPYLDSALDTQSSQIRIFTLLPATSKDAKLEGCLAVEQLSDTPEYEALSYVWGDTPRDHTIHVNDSKFFVGRDLFEALLELRLSTESRRLWIDAICINQANVLERNHQVSQMRSIYSTASRVLIWLGVSDAQIREAMTILREHEADAQRLREDRSLLAAVKPGLEKLLRRPWFSRVWTVQELVVANMDPLAGCGDQWVPWDSIWHPFIHIHYDWGNTWTTFTEQERLALGFLMRARREFQRDSTISLKNLIKATNMHNSLDPRDRIFALLGLIDSKTRPSIDVDYGLDKSAVYQQATLAMLREGSALEFLFRHGTDRDRILPTWCIDFSRGKCGPPKGKNISSGSSVLSWSEHAKILDGNVQLGTLALEGCSIGKVQRLLSSRLHISQEEDAVEAYNAEEQLCERRNAVNMFILDVVNTFVRTLENLEASARIAQGVVRNTIVNGRTTNDILSKCRDYVASLEADNGFQYVQSTATGLVPNCSDISPYSKLDEDLDAVPDCPENPLHSLKAMVDSLPKDTILFTTENGHIGTAYHPIEEGDELCVLAGFDLPVLLRSDNDKHILLCPAEVDDLIHDIVKFSESWEDTRVFETTVFCLK